MSKTADDIMPHAEDEGKRKDSGKSPLTNAGQFLQDTRAELKRVSWPSTNDVKNTTIIVIVNVIFFSIFLYLVDKGWDYILLGVEWLAKKAFGIS